MILITPLIATLGYGAVVLDRIAVIVGNHVIKASDIQRDLRVTTFLNRERLDFTPEARHQAAERLIDQEIIRQEIVTGGYSRPPESQADALEKQLIDDRFAGVESRLRQSLGQYGLSEGQLRSQLLWQLTVLQFVDQRFRPTVYVTDEDVRSYFEQHSAEVRARNSQNNGFEAVQGDIRNLLEGERINANFNAWLADARKRYQIEYKQEAFT